MFSDYIKIDHFLKNKRQEGKRHVDIFLRLCFVDRSPPGCPHTQAPHGRRGREGKYGELSGRFKSGYH